MASFITLTVSLSEESFDYLYQYAKRESLDLNSAIDSIILFDETPMSPQKDENNKDSKLTGHQCKVLIVEMLKNGDQPAKKITTELYKIGFSRSQIDRGMRDVSSCYSSGRAWYRHLTVSPNSITEELDKIPSCSLCGGSILGVEKSGMCESCQIEYRRVINSNARAKRLGLKHELTIAEWMDVLNEKGRTCVYCGGRFEELDHIIPIVEGGGSIKSNVVPSCKKCNLGKKFI